MSNKLNHKLFGKAVLIGDFENQSAEWHELRSNGIGGSQVGTILGVNPWESAYTMWAKLTNKIEDSFQQNEKMRWGTLVEPLIFDEWGVRNPEYKMYTTGTWADGWKHANPDGILELDGDFGLLEIKTAGYRWDSIPEHYVAQCMWYMELLGLKWCKVVVLFQGNQLETFHLDYDADYSARMVTRVEEFWDKLAHDVAPDWDGSESTFQTVRFMNPDVVDDEVDLGVLGSDLVYAQAELDLSTEQVTKLKSKILDKMGKAKYGLVNGKVIATRSSRAGGTPYLTIKKGN
jgi:putative phage-type endonuclease